MIRLFHFITSYLFDNDLEKNKFVSEKSYKNNITSFALKK